MASFRGFTFNGLYKTPWKQFWLDLFHEVDDDNLTNGSAALAYYLMLAIFPGLIFLLNLLPYLRIPNLHDAIMQFLGQLLPGPTVDVLNGTVTKIVSTKKESLLSFGAVLTLWAASSGISSLMQELNVSYDVKEGRSYLKAKGIAILLTLGFGVLVIGSFLLIMLGENAHVWVAEHWIWSRPLLFLFDLARWLIIIFSIVLALAGFYYFGPDVKQEFIFITPGSLCAAVLFILSSLGFKIYADHFGNYDATYGSLGAMIVLMVWLNILGFIILLGSQLNALIEHYSPEGKSKGEKSASGVGPSSDARTPTSPVLPPRTVKV